MEYLLNLPIYTFDTVEGWRKWLEDHHKEPEGVWLKIAKKDSGVVTVSYLEALEEAICYGWIDGLKRSYDERFFLQKFTPRRPKSMWSKVNIQRVETLIESHRMQAAGLKEVEAAKQDGRWAQAYDAASTMEMPNDFKEALDNNPKARSFYDTLNKTNTYAFLFRIQTAKKPETRQARISTFIQMLENGQKFH